MPNKRLFIAGLPWGVKDSDLAEIFSIYGRVTYFRVIVDRETNKSKGYGFIEFETVEDAKIAIEKADGMEVWGRKIIVKMANPIERKPYER